MEGELACCAEDFAVTGQELQEHLGRGGAEHEGCGELSVVDEVAVACRVGGHYGCDLCGFVSLGGGCDCGFALSVEGPDSDVEVAAQAHCFVCAEQAVGSESIGQVQTGIGGCLARGLSHNADYSLDS